MIKKIITDENILSQECKEWDIEDAAFDSEVINLVDTAMSIKGRCAGLAFNQIGVMKRGFVVRASENAYHVIINPRYILKSPTVKSRLESCLSRPGKDPIKKRRSVKVRISYHDPVMKKNVIGTFHQLQARVVQHEMDHLNGVLI